MPRRKPAHAWGSIRKSWYFSGCFFCLCQSGATIAGPGAWASPQIGIREVLEIGIILFSLLVNGIIAASYGLKHLQQGQSWGLDSGTASRRRKGRRQEEPWSSEYFQLQFQTSEDGSLWPRRALGELFPLAPPWFPPLPWPCQFGLLPCVLQFEVSLKMPPHSFWGLRGLRIPAPLQVGAGNWEHTRAQCHIHYSLSSTKIDGVSEKRRISGRGKAPVSWS